MIHGLTFTYIEQHQTGFIEELKDFLRIPSISTNPDHQPDIMRAANWLVDHCRSLGMTRAEVMPTPGHPIVYAEWLGAPGAPTVIFYGHYDVQPADNEGWQTDPFEPVVKDDKLYGRGTADDKGQVFIHLKAFEALMKTTGTFPVNFKLLVEGEEEIGSTHLWPFIRERRDLLKADVGVVSDTGLMAPGVPTIVYGLRGMMAFEVEVTGPRHDLHSGLFGGTVHNPAHALSQIIASLHDAQGRVAIEGFYDDVRDLPDEERATLTKLGYTEEMWQQETGAPRPWGDSAYTLRERMGARPTIEVNGLFSGYTGPGSKSIIPEKATAKITCRLVPNQDPNKLMELIQEHIEAHTPATVRSLVYPKRGMPGVIVDRHSPPMQLAVEAYRRVFGKEALFSLEGGSIPAVMMLKETLGVPVIMMGFGLPDDNLHAPNEKFDLEQFRLGLQTVITYYQLLRERMG